MGIDDYEEINAELFAKYESVCFITLLFFNLIALGDNLKNCKTGDERHYILYAISQNIDYIVDELHAKGVNYYTIETILNDYDGIPYHRLTDKYDGEYLIDRQVYDTYTKDKVIERSNKIIKYLNR